MIASTAPVLRFGLVGCGRIGRRHAEIIHQQFKLVAVCDAVADKALSFAQHFGAAAFPSFSKFLSARPDCDMVVVATPNSLHAVQTIALLKAGYHVVCEKPMALTAAAAAQMIEAATLYQRKLWVVKQNRFNPPVQIIKELLQGQAPHGITQVSLQCFWNREADYYNGWKGTLRFDGGTLYTQFSHFIDVAIWLCGPLQKGRLIVSETGHYSEMEFEDSGVVTAQFRSGALFSMAYSIRAFEKNMEGSLSILSKFGSYKIGGEYLNTLAYHQPAVPDAGSLPHGPEANNYGSYRGSMSNHPVFYTQLAKSLQQPVPEVDDLQSGYSTVDFIEQLYMSIGRKPADVENPDEAP